MRGENHFPLFKTEKAKGRILYRLFAASMFVGIALIWVYRATHFPAGASRGDGTKFGWIGMFGAELWFGLYWIFTQSFRWNPIYRYTFKDRLSHRYENDLPGVDISVCTADPDIEPPVMVINTVLSVMAYDYPPEKLSVYVSDDAGSDLTFYALLEAANFSKFWLPFCKKFDVEPRSPAVYFTPLSHPEPLESRHSQEFTFIKSLYEEMEIRIKSVANLGHIPEDVRQEYKAFSQWDSFISRRDHDTILQVLIDGSDSEAKDAEGRRLPTLVYLAREKRPQHPHNFKAGALNALIRVSSKISNGPIILNVDCDMFSNNSKSIRDALCFLMDEEKGHEFAFVQFPQKFKNVTENDIYSSSIRLIEKVDFHGLDGYGGPLYVGTGCFHRRDTLCGAKFSKERRIRLKGENKRKMEEGIRKLEQKVKILASCTYEENSQWGNEVGLIYGCPVEDVITGLSIQCNGWKSVYFNPTKPGFLGLAPTTLDQTLVQYKRWSEGDFLILFSKYSPVWHALGKISPGLAMGYCSYGLWSANCFATLYYSIIPSLYLVRGIYLFPEISSPWIWTFVYVIAAKYIHSLVEFLWCDGTVLAWWHDQRMWLYKRTSSFLFAFLDVMLKLGGFSNSSFVITAKVADEDVSRRFEQEKMEFGTSSPMITILAFLAMLNLFCFIGLVKRVLSGNGIRVLEAMALQIFLCGVLVTINFPLYHALFLRKDKGKIPSSVKIKSTLLALFVCTSFAFLY